MEAFEELKRQIEALGFDEKQSGEFLMEEWHIILEEKWLELKWEAEEKQFERQEEAEEKWLEHEREDKQLEHERKETWLEREQKSEEKWLESEHEAELERTSLQLQIKRLEIGNGSRSEEVTDKHFRSKARSRELPLFVDGKDSYLLQFEKYATMTQWRKEDWAT